MWFNGCPAPPASVFTTHFTHTHLNHTPTPHSFCFDLLVASLCPAIFGHELVKAGLLLTLLGGTKRQNDAATGAARTRVRVRSDPHILLVVRSVLPGGSKLSSVVGERTIRRRPSDPSSPPP